MADRNKRELENVIRLCVVLSAVHDVVSEVDIDDEENREELPIGATFRGVAALLTPTVSAVKALKTEERERLLAIAGVIDRKIVRRSEIMALFEPEGSKPVNTALVDAIGAPLALAEDLLDVAFGTDVAELIYDQVPDVEAIVKTTRLIAEVARLDERSEENLRDRRRALDERAGLSAHDRMAVEND
jgi:hypothetical protein